MGFMQNTKPGISLAVKWLRLQASTAGSEGLSPGWRTKIPHTTWDGQKKEKERDKNIAG